MNKYSELRQRQQEEVNALPIGFAFSDKQFREMMEGWGLDPEKDLDKIYKLGGTGGFYKRTDAQLIRDTLSRHEEERQAAIAGDETGEGFIYQMFLAELADREYDYTEDADETLEALGYTWEQVTADKRLLHGLEMAQKRILSRG